MKYHMEDDHIGLKDEIMLIHLTMTESIFKLNYFILWKAVERTNKSLILARPVQKDIRKT